MPWLAEDEDGDGDGETDAELDGEDPAVAVELGVPGDRDESGAVVLPWADTDGASPVPPSRLCLPGSGGKSAR